MDGIQSFEIMTDVLSLNGTAPIVWGYGLLLEYAGGAAGFAYFITGFNHYWLIPIALSVFFRFNFYKLS